MQNRQFLVYLRTLCTTYLPLFTGAVRWIYQISWRKPLQFAIQKLSEKQMNEIKLFEWHLISLPRQRRKMRSCARDCNVFLSAFFTLRKNKTSADVMLNIFSALFLLAKTHILIINFISQREAKGKSWL